MLSASESEEYAADSVSDGGMVGSTNFAACLGGRRLTHSEVRSLEGL